MKATIPSAYQRAFFEVLNKSSYPKFRPIRYPLATLGLIATFWPLCPPRHRVEAHCSTIHVDSVLVLLYARRDLRFVCDLDITFHDTSSVALKFFQESSEPALITVTQGTANKLDGDARYAKILQVQPGILRWTSPDMRSESRIRDRRAPRLLYNNHPTDLLAVMSFQKFLSTRNDRTWSGMEFEVTPPSSSIPENLDFYKPGAFYLTNSFMDLWALETKDKGREPSVIPGWESVEKRYVFGNSFFCDLVDGKGASVALFLQDYLSQCYENLHNMRFSAHTGLVRMGDNYMQAGGRYLGVL